MGSSGSFIEIQGKRIHKTIPPTEKEQGRGKQKNMLHRDVRTRGQLAAK